MLTPRYVDLLDRGDARAGHRNLYDHVRREAIECESLFDNRRRVAEVARVGLDGEAAVAPRVLLECRFEQSRRSNGQLLDQLPADLVFRGRGQLAQQGLDPGPPSRQFLLQHRHGDHRVARGSDRPVLDGTRELVNRRRVVPKAGGGRLRHLVQKALVGNALRGCGHDLSLRGRRGFLRLVVPAHPIANPAAELPARSFGACSISFRSADSRAVIRSEPSAGKP